MASRGTEIDPGQDPRRRAITWAIRVFWIHLVVIGLIELVVVSSGGTGYPAVSARAVIGTIDFMVADLILANVQRLPYWLFSILGGRFASLYLAEWILHGVAGGLAYSGITFVLVYFLDRRKRVNSRDEPAR